MNAVNFSDAQLDAAAQRYAMANRVSYSDALHAVVWTAQYAEATTAAAVGEDGAEPLSDEKLHLLATAYALANRLDYASALVAVVDSRQKRRAAAGRVTQVNHSPESDKRLHQAAVAYSEANSVSYAEALSTVAEGASGGNAQQTLQAQQIEIFRAGTHVDAAGVSRVFTVDDVKAMAAVYDPAIHEAPLTIGHPADDKPAYGWVSSLTATDNGVLLMQSRKVDSAFAADLAAGRYLKRSASFYSPMAPTNPVPGRWYLRHVAWLGAMAPAVKSLADVNFGAFDGAGCFDF